MRAAGENRLTRIPVKVVESQPYLEHKQYYQGVIGLPYLEHK